MAYAFGDKKARTWFPAPIMWPSNKPSPAKALVFLSFLISLSITGVIFIFLLRDSYPIFQYSGLKFFTGEEWYPGEVYGALPMFYGTAIVTLLALCLALPLGLGSALMASEFLSGRGRLLAKLIMELLAGIPGVVYGLLGMRLLTTAVRKTFGLVDGNCIFSAGALLGVMILPTIMTLSEDALRAVPREYREQALALGLTRSEMICFAVMPQALKGIVGAVLLALSRAMGETIAVMLVIGSLDRIPTPFYNIFATAQTITSKLGREAAEALGVGYHWNALVGLGLVLFIAVMAIALAGEIFYDKRLQVNSLRVLHQRSDDY